MIKEICFKLHFTPYCSINKCIECTKHCMSYICMCVWLYECVFIYNL